MSWITFDIETAPLDDETLRGMLPPFDESSVKYGNTKDEAKRAAKLEECKAKHEQEFFSRAALSPMTGRVLCIGFYVADACRFNLLEGENEADLLICFWLEANSARNRKTRLAGVNIFGFDLPFLVRRSWMLGVSVPPHVVQFEGQWIRWSPTFLDLRRVWQLGDNQAESNFDHIGRCLGTGGKCAGDIGADFHKVWRDDRDRAIEYLKNDVTQPAVWLQRMGLNKDWL